MNLATQESMKWRSAWRHNQQRNREAENLEARQDDRRAEHLESIRVEKKVGKPVGDK